MDSTATLNRYLDLLREQNRNPTYISGEAAINHAQSYQGNIENFIGFMEPILREHTRSASRFAKLIGMETLLEGNGVHVTFSFETGAAAGQNMVTIATEYILKAVLAQSPKPPTLFYIDANMSGDKKANLRSLSNVRGRKVISELNLRKDGIRDVLKSSAEEIAKLWQTGTISAVQAGAVGNPGHISNALTAIFIACGQDVACIAEAAVGISRVEAKPNGDLYASMTLPGLIVGTVGGGTSLPTQREALELMDCSAAEDVEKFAEICCSVALAGELSIGAAIVEGHFVSAHKAHGRKG